jgi:Domain of unknown function (DUF4395)
MTNKNVECPVDLILINEKKARLTAGSVCILMVIYLFTNFLAIPVFLVLDFFARGFNLGRYSPLNLMSDLLIHIFNISPKLIDQAPKRFAAKIGFLFSITIVVFFAFQFETVSFIISLVLATFALLESSMGFCAGCHVYHFYSKIVKKKTSIYSLCIIIACISYFHPAKAQTAKNETFFTIENYYKIKWGYADEFINLWKVNHYPLLKKAKENGDIISVIAEKPMLHSVEDTRWDFKVTIIFKTSEKAFDANITEPYKTIIFPDQGKLKKDEQHRFELLLSHWDIITEKIPVE